MDYNESGMSDGTYVFFPSKFHFATWMLENICNWNSKMSAFVSFRPHMNDLSFDTLQCIIWQKKVHHSCPQFCQFSEALLPVLSCLQGVRCYCCWVLQLEFRSQYNDHVVVNDDYMSQYFLADFQVFAGRFCHGMSLFCDENSRCIFCFWRFNRITFLLSFDTTFS